MTKRALFDMVYDTCTDAMDFDLLNTVFNVVFVRLQDLLEVVTQLWSVTKTAGTLYGVKL